MTGDEFRGQMDLLAAAGRIVLEVDVDALRAFVSAAETLSPILEPTAYMRGGDDNLRAQSAFLRGAAVFREACESLRPAS